MEVVELWRLGLVPQAERAEKEEKVQKAKMDVQEQRCDLQHWEDPVVAVQVEVAGVPILLRSLFLAVVPQS